VTPEPTEQAPGADTSDASDVPDAVSWGTEDGLASVFTRRFGKDWRYIAAWGRWLTWTGRRWNEDIVLHVQHLVRGICRSAAARADSPRLKAKLASASTISAVERIARSDPKHAATVDEWDADIWLLNTVDGVVNLKTGAMRAHDSKDRMTKITTASPRGQCPLWLSFLEQVTGGDKDLQDYLQRAAGYFLTGSTQEHALFFLYGTGSNGKSVFVNTLVTIWGDYAANAPMETFMDNRNDRHPTDLAGLRGARVVTATETEQGRRWNESRIKEITGGDRITARFMHKDNFTYPPTYKVLMSGNHKPAIRNVDEAMRRRMHLIPFEVTIPREKRDRQLQDKLLKERDGILAWALEGCMQWQRMGLCPPESVQVATSEYFEAEDAMGRWIEERCVLTANAKSLTAELFTDWKQWAEGAGEFAGSQRRFSDLLTARGTEKWRNGMGLRGFKGIGLKVSPSVPQHYSDL
jgi:putative DNA primase/helicase